MPSPSQILMTSVLAPYVNLKAQGYFPKPEPVKRIQPSIAPKPKVSFDDDLPLSKVSSVVSKSTNNRVPTQDSGSFLPDTEEALSLAEICPPNDSLPADSFQHSSTPGHISVGTPAPAVAWNAGCFIAAGMPTPPKLLHPNTGKSLIPTEVSVPSSTPLLVQAMSALELARHNRARANARLPPVNPRPSSEDSAAADSDSEAFNNPAPPAPPPPPEPPPPPWPPD